MKNDRIMENQSPEPHADDNVSLFGRTDFAFLHFIWMSTIFRFILYYCVDFMVFIGFLAACGSIGLLLLWLLSLLLIAYCTTRHRECLMSILIYVGWLAMFFYELGWEGASTISRTFDWRWILEVLAARAIILFFILYANKLKYAFAIKFVICLLVLIVDIRYWRIFYIGRDCILSLMYVSYAYCKSKGMKKGCDNVLLLSVIALLLPSLHSIMKYGFSDLFEVLADVFM